MTSVFTVSFEKCVYTKISYLDNNFLDKIKDFIKITLSSCTVRSFLQLYCEFLAKLICIYIISYASDLLNLDEDLFTTLPKVVHHSKGTT